MVQRSVAGAVAVTVVGVAVVPSALAAPDAHMPQTSATGEVRGEATGRAGDVAVLTMLDLPVTGPILRRFQAPDTPYGPGHRGVKFQVPAGEVVRAAGVGLVHHAGDVAGVGWVSIDHGDGRLTSYGPVEAIVRRGQPVAAGQPIGHVDGATPGAAGDVGMHWGLRAHGVYEDPLGNVRRQRPSLVGPGDLALVVGAMWRYPP